MNDPRNHFMINLHESMGPDEQSALDQHCLFKRLHNISIDDKKYDCVVIYALRIINVGSVH